MAIRENTEHKSRKSSSKESTSSSRTRKSSSETKSSSSKKKTKAFQDEYKGKPTLAIHNVDSSGEPVGDFPIISFGVAKAKAILKHIKDIEAFVEENSEE